MGRNRQEEMITYAQALSMAHARYESLSIHVELLQSPNADNHNTAICSARVEGRRDGSRIEMFTDIGDAAPHNTARNIQPHLIRMASTRAQARALKAAVNRGETAAEEFGGGESAAETSRPSQWHTEPAQETTEGGQGEANASQGGSQGGATASAGQIRAISGLAETLYGSVTEMLDTHTGTQTVAELTPQQANELYQTLREEQSEGEE